MTPEQISLIMWARRERAYRTKAIKMGVGRIDWLDPGTRVSMTEIIAKAEEIGMDPCKDILAFRLWWDEARKWKPGVSNNDA
jgi:hypothetical protein